LEFAWALARRSLLHSILLPRLHRAFVVLLVCFFDKVSRMFETREQLREQLFKQKVPEVAHQKVQEVVHQMVREMSQAKTVEEAKAAV